MDKETAPVEPTAVTSLPVSTEHTSLVSLGSGNKGLPATLCDQASGLLDARRQEESPRTTWWSHLG